jgi:cellulose synthase/poly-beta-1,6-N-acetylglucosamine synthase-like glycosyltransferase
MLLLVLAAQLTAGVLLAFSARRAVLLAAAVAPQPPGPALTPAPGQPAADRPRVEVLVPCHNEAASLPKLFPALEALDYPRAALRVTLVDDASSDRSAVLAQAWAEGQPWARVLALPGNVGKAQALNLALAAELHPDFEPEIVAVYDADHLPRPDALRALVAPFAQPEVAGVSGQMHVDNGLESLAAGYALIESDVNQFVTMRAKDRLNLAPALLGSNCAYRLAALRAVQGFRGGALLEDSDLTLALAQAGLRTRFAPASISGHHAPRSVAGYIQQHLRWNRGFHQVSRGRLWGAQGLWRDRRLSLLMKIELTFFAFGYADRLALLAGAAFALADWIWPGTFEFPLAALVIYFALPALEMVAALALAGEPPAAFARLAVVPFFFALDITIAVWAMAQSVLRRPLRWTATERPNAGQPAPKQP